jgi:hypothetical protein
MLRHMALIRTDVSEEHSTPIIRVSRIGELRTALAVTSSCRSFCLRCMVTSSSKAIVVLHGNQQ